MDPIMDFLGKAWDFLVQQGVAGDVLKWAGGVAGGLLSLAAGLPIVGGAIGAIIKVFKPSSNAAYNMGITYGLALSTFMRKIKFVGKYWEFVEDRILLAFADFMRGVKAGADQDDSL